MHMNDFIIMNVMQVIYIFCDIVQNLFYGRNTKKEIEAKPNNNSNKNK